MRSESVRIVLLFPLSLELRAVRRVAASSVRRSPRGPRVERLELAGMTVHAVVAGQGREASARTAAWAIDELRPRALVVAGVAGGARADQRPGDLVLLEGATESSGKGRVASDPALVAAAAGALDAAGLRASRGDAASVGTVASADVKRALGEAGALAVDMESHAVLEAARAAGVRAVGLRAISDAAGTNVPRSAIALGAAQSGRGLTAMRDAWRLPFEVRALIRTARDFSTATRSLADALPVCLPAVRRALDEGGSAG